jgi:hypothetical protein
VILNCSRRGVGVRLNKRVVRRGELQQNDYDFRSWGKDEKLRDAGCAYEYARESHKFRCLLLLTGPRRKRERSETGLWIEFKGTRPEKRIIRRKVSYLSESGWESWLRGFTAELAANKSFTDVLSTNRQKVEDSLAALVNYSLLPKAVELPGRHINYPGSQDVLIQICWRHYTNTGIGEEMKILADKIRPAGEPEPATSGTGKRSSTESLLDALSAMRLASHYRTRDAIKRFSEIQLGYIGRKDRADVAPKNFSKLVQKAVRIRAAIFPFGENAANAVEFSERE